MSHRAGFTNIIGPPNAGKSTLMNAMVGEKLSIITSRAQTTRHRIMGIVSGDDFQIVYSDTPGIINPAYALQEAMMHFIDTALEDADIILLVLDVKNPGIQKPFLDRLAQTSGHVIVVLNKVDLSSQEEIQKMITAWQSTLQAAEIIPVSALHRFNLDKLFNTILHLLPESPPFFPKDQLTDKLERFFAAETLREKILLNYRQEIPYACEVGVDAYKDEKGIAKIRCLIFVEKESQKRILIGHKGEAIKKTGTEARKELERFLQKKVYLEVFVKVRKKWRDDDQQLKRFGYL